MIHEFDPYFNYRTMLFLTEKGFYEFDSESWYPLVPPLYPGIMFSSTGRCAFSASSFTSARFAS